jgi:hypothetical protein
MDPPGVIPALIGAPLAAADGEITGTVAGLLVDSWHRPAWLVVRLTGPAGGHTFVPALRMRNRRAGVAVAHGAEVIRSAPVRLAAPAVLAPGDAVRLCRHYGVRAPAMATSVHTRAAGGGSAAIAVAA